MKLWVEFVVGFLSYAEQFCSKILCFSPILKTQLVTSNYKFNLVHTKLHKQLKIGAWKKALTDKDYPSKFPSQTLTMMFNIAPGYEIATLLFLGLVVVICG